MSDFSLYSSADPQTLVLRSDLLHLLRSFFRQQNFVEVETPILSQDTVIDLYVDPMCVEYSGQSQRYLQTSPEFGMKRLLASGLDRIFQITRVFRMEESGPRHNPEFTMLEWYRCGDSYNEGRALLAQLIDFVTSSSLFSQPVGNCQQEPFAEVFKKYTSVHPFLATTECLTKMATEFGLAFPEGLGNEENSLLRREAINFLWAERVDPHLGLEHPVIIYDWPGSEAALAQTRMSSEGAISFEVAERFELYLHAVELANGYHELLDPEVLEKRNQQTNAQRNEIGKTLLPTDSRLLQVMKKGLPASCGVAMGVDRLLMCLIGATNIDQVIAFPWDRA